MMGERTFHLVITSVTGAQFDGDALSVTVPGNGGTMTVLPNHEPLVTTLTKGSVTVRPAVGDVQTFEIENGVLETSGDRATVLL